MTHLPRHHQEKTPLSHAYPATPHPSITSARVLRHPRESGDPGPRLHDLPPSLPRKNPALTRIPGHTPPLHHPRARHSVIPAKAGTQAPVSTTYRRHCHEKTPLSHAYPATPHPSITPARATPSSPRKRGPRPPSPRPTYPVITKKKPRFHTYTRPHPTPPSPPRASSVIPAKAGTQALVSTTYRRHCHEKTPLSHAYPANRPDPSLPRKPCPRPDQNREATPPSRRTAHPAGTCLH